MKIRSLLPIIDWLPSYKFKSFRADLLAGLTVAVMLVPQGMAYGLLAGLPPIYGLYAGIVPLLLYAFFGTSRQLSVGPVALVSLLVLSGISKFADQQTDLFIQLAIATALIAGILQIIFGIFKLGFLINFLSHPVLAGFTSAAALIIGFSQLGNLLGIEIQRSNLIYEILFQAYHQLDAIHWPTLGIGLGGIIIIFVLRAINKRIPNALLVVVVGTLLVYYFRLDLNGVAIVASVPEGLPKFSIPTITLKQVEQLLPLSLTICLISFIESLAIAKTIESRHKSYRIVPNQELIALGVTKIGGAFFQAFPTTGSFTRSAINDEAGAKTGISSIIAAIIICLTLLFITPLFYFLPKAILAAIIIGAVKSLIDYKEAFHLWKHDRRDFLTFLTTFLITLVLGIQSGVLVGIILSLALMVYTNSRPHIAILGRIPGTRHFRNIDRFEHAQQQKDILIMRFDAQLYFGNANYFREFIENSVEQNLPHLKLLILDASSIHDVDSSGIHTFHEVLQYLKSKGVMFYISGVIGPVRDLLYQNGLSEIIGSENQFMYIHDAVVHYNDVEVTWTPNALQTNISEIKRAED